MFQCVLRFVSVSGKVSVCVWCVCGLLLSSTPQVHVLIAFIVLLLRRGRVRVRSPSSHNYGRAGNRRETRLSPFRSLSLFCTRTQTAAPRDRGGKECMERESRTGKCHASTVLMLVGAAQIVVAHGRMARRLQESVQ